VAFSLHTQSTVHMFVLMKTCIVEWRSFLVENETLSLALCVPSGVVDCSDLE
jgi:hypothetical protein